MDAAVYDGEDIQDRDMLFAAFHAALFSVATAENRQLRCSEIAAGLCAGFL